VPGGLLLAALEGIARLRSVCLLSVVQDALPPCYAAARLRRPQTGVRAERGLAILAIATMMR
jgi:hypothetical protein